jgi:RNA polymerase subunit RPABC4/transcription elongation factor Spt4
MEPRSDAAQLLPCTHKSFCHTCLLYWLRDNSTCPVCRGQASHIRHSGKDTKAAEPLGYCALCTEHLTDPARLLPCNQRAFCHIYILYWLRDGNACPVCEEVPSYVRYDGSDARVRSQEIARIIRMLEERARDRYWDANNGN